MGQKRQKHEALVEQIVEVDRGKTKAQSREEFRISSTSFWVRSGRKEVGNQTEREKVIVMVRVRVGEGE